MRHCILLDGWPGGASAYAWLDVARGCGGNYRYDLPMAIAPVQALVNEELRAYWDVFRHERLRDVGYSLRVVGESEMFGAVEAQPIDCACGLVRVPLFT